MFVVAVSVEDGVWDDIAGIFATEEAARRFQESVRPKWSYPTFQMDFPDAYPFFMTGQGLVPPRVRPIRDDELRSLLAQVPPPTSSDDGPILFNVYAVLEDSFNRAFPGEQVLSKLGHYHVRSGQQDYDYIRRYLFRGR